MNSVKRKRILKKTFVSAFCAICLTGAATGIYLGISQSMNIEPEKKYEQTMEQSSNQESQINNEVYNLDYKTRKAIDNQSNLNCKFISAFFGYAIRDNAANIATKNPEINFSSMDDFVIKDNKIYLVDKELNINSSHDKDNNINYSLSFSANKITEFSVDKTSYNLFQALQNVEDFAKFYQDENISLDEFKESLKSVLAITGINYNDIVKLYMNKTGTIFDYTVEKIKNKLAPFMENALQNGTVINSNIKKTTTTSVKREDYNTETTYDSIYNTYNKTFVNSTVEKISEAGKTSEK